MVVAPNLQTLAGVGALRTFGIVCVIAAIAMIAAIARHAGPIAVAPTHRAQRYENPPQAPRQVQICHMTFGDDGIPIEHTEMLWGDYVNQQGDPAVGWHSHDPTTGNARHSGRRIA